VADGRAEQARLVSSAEVVQAAHRESARIMDAATEQTDRLRAECDEYVDGKLAEFEDLLDRTMRTVSRGRGQLRGPVGAADSRGRVGAH
jgi:cell division septum initiation protein DivIVA